MSDELRAPLLKALERLKDDLALGERFGDPHLAFVTLVYPDDPPTVVAVTERGICGFDRIVAKTAEEADDRHVKDGRFFQHEELAEARVALDAADAAFGSFRYRNDKDVSLGAHIVDEIAKRIERHRSAPIEAALKNAAYEERMKWKCGGCGNRYGTERGLHMHQSRTLASQCKAALDERLALDKQAG